MLANSAIAADYLYSTAEVITWAMKYRLRSCASAADTGVGYDPALSAWDVVMS
jgi:hypothetical protein